MARLMSSDTLALLKRRLPHVAIIEREDPFLDADQELLEEQCRRIAEGQEFHHTIRYRGDRDEHVVHFATEHQARALQEWVWRERFYARPRPRSLGPTRQERRAFEEAALRWGIRTGALRRVVQAYRRRARENGSLLQCHTAAQRALQLYLPPHAGYYDMAQVFVSWAMREHSSWFWGNRQSAVNWWQGPDEFAPEDAYPHSES